MGRKTFPFSDRRNNYNSHYSVKGLKFLKIHRCQKGQLVLCVLCKYSTTCEAESVKGSKMNHFHCLGFHTCSKFQLNFCLRMRFYSERGPAALPVCGSASECLVQLGLALTAGCFPLHPRLQLFIPSARVSAEKCVRRLLDGASYCAAPGDGAVGPLVRGPLCSNRC